MSENVERAAIRVLSSQELLSVDDLAPGLTPLAWHITRGLGAVLFLRPDGAGYVRLLAMSHANGTWALEFEHGDRWVDSQPLLASEFALRYTTSLRSDEVADGRLVSCLGGLAGNGGEVLSVHADGHRQSVTVHPATRAFVVICEGTQLTLNVLGADGRVVGRLSYP